MIEKEHGEFSCILNKSKQKVEWFFNEKKLENNNKFEISQRHNMYFLLIKDCKKKDEGYYTIKSSSDIMSHAKLTVKCN